MRGFRSELLGGAQAVTAVVALAHALGLTGLFATRVFVPMFAAAATLRVAPQVTWLSDLGLLAGIAPGSVPTWFTDDATLVVLGCLAAAELMAHRSAGARELLNAVDRWGKPVAAVLTFLGVLSVTDLAALQLGPADPGIGSVALALLVGGGTVLTSGVNGAVLGRMIEADEDDDAGVVGLYEWAQDLWALFGIFFLILFPVVMVGLILLAMGLLALVQRWAEARERKGRVPCEACGKPMYRSALSCGGCGEPNPVPTELDWLGISTNRPVANGDRHPFVLVKKKRCRRCADRFQRREVHQECPTCGTPAFEDVEFAAAYDRLVSSRLGEVLLVCALLSLIPVIGLIPGVIFYRVTLVAPYRRYLGRGRSFVLKWAVRALLFVLILVQLVPVLGITAVPLMALVSHGVYRSAFWKQVQRKVAVRPALA